MNFKRKGDHLHYFFSSIGVVFLDLRIRELEDLEAVRVSCLRGLGLGKIVYDLLVWIGLLDIVVIEIDDRVPVGERLSAHAVAEDDLFLAVEVRSLHFSVVADDLVLHLRILLLLVVILVRELHLIILFVIV